MSGRPPGGAADARRRDHREQAAATTKADLLQLARERFARDGYSGTSLDAIAHEAGLSKGAICDYCGSKLDLFAAVFEEEERLLCEKVEAAAAGVEDRFEAARLRWKAFLDGVSEPSLQRIALIDAPSVLGRKRFHEIASRHGLAAIKKGLKQIVADPGRHDVEALARLLHGSLTEGALMISRSSDPAATREAVEREFAYVMFELAAPN